LNRYESRKSIIIDALLGKYYTDVLTKTTKLHLPTIIDLFKSIRLVSKDSYKYLYPKKIRGTSQSILVLKYYSDFWWVYMFMFA
jgi:hypothetical protein